MRKTIVTLAALFCAASVSAQQNDPSISRQIEVTKQYVPEVEGARKLYFKPRIGDTVNIKPDIDYAIRPTPWKSVFGTQPIAPVNISTARYTPSRPFYLKAAAGAPFQTLLDFYAAANIDPSRGAFGVYLNHKGEWQEKSFTGSRADITPWSENRIGIYGSKTIGRRSLDAEVGYNLRSYFPNMGLLSGDVAHLQLYHGADAKITFGDAFTDFSRFNYRAGVSGAWTNSMYSWDNYDTRVFADFGWGLKKGVIIADVEFNGWFMNGLNDWYVGLTPQYKLDIKSFSLDAGVELLYNNYNRGELSVDKGGKFRVIPKIKAEYRVFNALIPYISIDGKIGSGNTSALSLINPFIRDWSVIERPLLIDMRGGVKGTAAKLISYDAYVGYADGSMPVFLPNNEFFDAYLADAGWFYAGAKAKLSFPFGLGVEIGGQYNKVDATANIVYTESDNIIDMGTRPVGLGIPQFTVGGEVSYNYRSKLFLRLGLEYAGTRELSSRNDGIVTLPATLNLKAEAEYVIKDRIGIFVTGDNLLGSEIYRYLNYRALGANFMVGVKLSL